MSNPERDRWQIDQSTTESDTSATPLLPAVAKVATDPGPRTILKEMAAEWLKLAETPAD